MGNDESVDSLVLLILYSIKSTKYAKNLKIQKMIYIYEKENDQGLFRANFQANKFGPYSQKVWNMLELLVTRRVILAKEMNYELTEFGKKILDKLMKENKKNKEIDIDFFEQICKYFNNASSNDLIKYVYSIYPDDLSQSLIINSIIYSVRDYEWIRITKENIKRIKENFKN